MSFSTVRLQKSQLPVACAHCAERFEAEWSLSNLGRSEEGKHVNISAHKVNGVYHAYHPRCLKESVKAAQRKGEDPRCGVCHADMETIEGRALRDIDQSSLIYALERIGCNSDPAIAERGHFLRLAAESPFAIFVKDKKTEIRNILSTGDVSIQDRSAAAISAFERKRYDCIPILINNGPLTANARDSIFAQAVWKQQWQIARALLPLGVSDEQQKIALPVIAAEGDLETLNALLAARSEEGGGIFPQKVMDLSVVQASIRGNAAFVKALLDHADLSEKGCAKAIHKAIACEQEPNQSREIVHLLLDKTKLSGCARSAAIVKALANGCFGIAYELLPTHK